jgi:hypothetical protein
MDKNEKLQRALLDEGANEAQAEEWAGELDAMLAKAAMPVMRLENKTALLSMMREQLPAPKSRMERFLESYPIALLLSQVRVIQREIWLASAVLLALGVFVTLTNNGIGFLPFATLAPIVAAGSIGMLFDSDFQAMLEIEETSRASARLLLLARLTLVFSFNLVVALAGSVILAIFDSETLLMPLILSWLAPMSFLSGLAFFLSITGRNTLFASGFSLVIWMGHLIFPTLPQQNWLTLLLSLPGLAEPSYRPLLVLTGLLLVVVSLWQVGVVERGASPDILE